MNRNVESHFAQTPTLDMPRSTFDRSSTHQTTFNVGDLIPFYVDEVYPGDTFKITTNKVVRLQTLLNPLMDTLYLDTYFFFVPNRLVWDHWQELMGENNESAWLPTIEYSTPVLTNPDDESIMSGSIEDYMGIPIGPTLEFNALPIRGYHLIWNEFFRDENLQDPLNIYKGDAKKKLISGNGSDDLSELWQMPRKAARYHDYFSSCLPAPQKGPDVTIPIANGTSYLPVFTRTETVPNLPAGSTTYPPGLKWFDAEGAYQTGVSFYDNEELAMRTSPLFILKNGEELNPSDDSVVYPNNLWAQYNIDSVTMASINDLRQAFQIQRLYERDAIGGKICCLQLKKIEEKNWKAA